MQVKSLIKLLKKPGIKGNAQILIDSINDSLIRGAVVYKRAGIEGVILTDIPEIVQERIEESEDSEFFKVIITEDY